MAPPVFKTGLAANIVAGGFDSLPSPPENRSLRWASFNSVMQSGRGGESAYAEDLKFSGGQPPCGFDDDCAGAADWACGRSRDNLSRNSPRSKPV